ncbi:hypothetical protein K439DRAFT_1324925, partial [Ramaria rubella]
FALNYTGVPNKTIWFDYPDIEPTMLTIGAAPTGTRLDGSPFYIDPSQRTSTGEPTVISDTWTIAEYLDRVYPEPGMLLPNGTKVLRALFQDHVTKYLFWLIS